MFSEHFSELYNLIVFSSANSSSGVKAFNIYSDKKVTIPFTETKNSIEILFCTEGSISLNSPAVSVNKEETFAIVLSNPVSLESITISPPFSGILIETDFDSVMGCFPFLPDKDGCKTLFKELAEKYSGIMPVKNGLWSQTAAIPLKALTDNEKCSYLSFKSAELIYILAKNPILLPSSYVAAVPDNYITRTVISMREYMENNLGEKITIDSISRKFNIAPTAFKENFRRLYGVSVHKWLQTRRIEHSRTLLRSTSMPILQIAHQVGYESTSQFNLAFRKNCGTSPGKYRKMSENIDF